MFLLFYLFTVTSFLSSTVGLPILKEEYQVILNVWDIVNLGFYYLFSLQSVYNFLAWPYKWDIMTIINVIKRRLEDNEIRDLIVCKICKMPIKVNNSSQP